MNYKAIICRGPKMRRTHFAWRHKPINKQTVECTNNQSSARARSSYSRKMPRCPNLWACLSEWFFGKLLNVCPPKGKHVTRRRQDPNSLCCLLLMAIPILSIRAIIIIRHHRVSRIPPSVSWWETLDMRFPLLLGGGTSGTDHGAQWDRFGNRWSKPLRGS